MTYEHRLEELKELITNIEYVRYTLNSLIYWDKITYMPPEGIEYRSRVMGFMADQQYQMMAGRKFTSHVKFFDGHKRNSNKTNAMIKRIRLSASYVNKIPEDEYREYIKLIAVSEQVWHKARKENDYNLFKPYLSKIIETFKSFANYWGYEHDPYDALLGYYEEGLNVKEMDEVVESVKEPLLSMVDFVKNKHKPEKNLCIGNIELERQKKVWELLLEKIGFDFNAGRLDTGSHTTILANSPGDVRVVNDYQEDDIRMGIFNVLHSGGKGVYQQRIDKGLLGTFLAEAPSFATEEAVGRFYESIIGRSRGFWEHVYPEVIEIIPEIEEIGFESFFKSINDYKPSLIRMDADELTYLIHVIIRYELEKDLIHDELTVADLPSAWNDKYQQYLGLRPSKDSEGVLQDIHWAAGYVGYFPSYFVSNLAAAQFAAAIERDKGDMRQLLASGNMETINQWMEEHIYRHGAIYSFSELIAKETGEALNAEHYIGHLRNRLSEVYNK
ncbi:carboxypeptidase Taq [Clostridiales Family XIII bacterium PM5-7]